MPGGYRLLFCLRKSNVFLFIIFLLRLLAGFAYTVIACSLYIPLEVKKKALLGPYKWHGANGAVVVWGCRGRPPPFPRPRPRPRTASLSARVQARLQEANGRLRQCNCWGCIWKAALNRRGRRSMASRLQAKRRAKACSNRTAIRRRSSTISRWRAFGTRG